MGAVGVITWIIELTHIKLVIIPSEYFHRVVATPLHFLGSLLTALLQRLLELQLKHFYLRGTRQ